MGAMRLMSLPPLQDDPNWANETELRVLVQPAVRTLIMQWTQVNLNAWAPPAQPSAGAALTKMGHIPTHPYFSPWWVLMRVLGGAHVGYACEGAPARPRGPTLGSRGMVGTTMLWFEPPKHHM